MSDWLLASSVGPDQRGGGRKFGNGTNCGHAPAVTGDGMLFFDPDGRSAITEQRQHVFTEWGERRRRNGPEDRFRRRTREARARTAGSDMEALRSYFDTNGDGKLTSADADFAKFKVLVTNADGSTTVKTLAQLGITENNLTEDATRIVLPDGSVIDGQTTVKWSNLNNSFGGICEFFDWIQRNYSANEYFRGEQNRG